MLILINNDNEGDDYDNNNNDDNQDNVVKDNVTQLTAQTYWEKSTLGVPNRSWTYDALPLSCKRRNETNERKRSR